MSKTEHTPGPWACDVTDQGGAGCESYVAITAAVDGEHQQIIAKVICYDDRLNPLPYRDTAHILVAAPDQNAEMLRFLPILERAEADPEIWEKLTEGTGIATANSFRAAIAKAEGRS